MIGKRGLRKASTRIRLAVAAAVLVGGGAAGAVAVAANHGGITAAESAGYYSHSGRWMSETQAMSSAMNGWNQNSNRSIQEIAEMKPVSSVSSMAWHKHVIAIQLGRVVAESNRQKELVVQSANDRVEVWHWNAGTKAVNVGSSSMGMDAMTGGSMQMPSWANHLNTRSRAAVVGDVVFVFGEKVRGELIIQLVLFISPMNPVTTPTNPVIPTATPSMTPTARPTSTVTAVPTPTGTMTFAGNNS